MATATRWKNPQRSVKREAGNAAVCKKAAVVSIAAFANDPVRPGAPRPRVHQNRGCQRSVWAPCRRPHSSSPRGRGWRSTASSRPRMSHPTASLSQTTMSTTRIYCILCARQATSLPATTCDRHCAVLPPPPRCSTFSEISTYRYTQDCVSFYGPPGGGLCATDNDLRRCAALTKFCGGRADRARMRELDVCRQLPTPPHPPPPSDRGGRMKHPNGFDGEVIAAAIPSSTLSRCVANSRPPETLSRETCCAP